MRGLRIALVALALAACGGPPERVWITGWVEAPEGVHLDDVTILAFRGKTVAPWTGRTERVQPMQGRLWFELGVHGTDPVTLIPAKIPLITRDALRTAPDPARQIYAIDGCWGIARDVVPGARDIVIRLERFATAHLPVRVLDLAGRPVPGSKVRLLLSDRPDYWISAVTDAQGQVTIRDVPVERWTLEASPRQEDWPQLVPGRRDVTASGEQLDVQLRRAILVRAGVRGPVPDGAFLVFGEAGGNPRTLLRWKSDGDGGVDLPAEPQWESLSVSLHQPLGESRSRVLVETSVKIREGASLELVVPR